MSLKAAAESQSADLYDDVRYVVEQAQNSHRRNRWSRPDNDGRWNEPEMRKLAVLTLGWVCDASKHKNLEELLTKSRNEWEEDIQ